MKGVKQTIYDSVGDAVTTICVRSSHHYDENNLRDMLYLMLLEEDYIPGVRVLEIGYDRGNWSYYVEYISDTIEGRFLTPAIVLGFLRQIERDLEEVLRMKEVVGLLRDDDA